MISDIVDYVKRLTREKILQLLEQVQPIFRKESRLIVLPRKPLLLVGDTHGDWEATQTLLNRYWDSPVIFVFLGDYVDRGPFQIENMNLLFELKIKSPDRIIILRGNHETPSVNLNYGFYDEVQRRLDKTIDQYWEIFAQLPLAAINRDYRVFAVHGGIAENMEYLEEITELPREKEPKNPIAFQLLWNDPKETLRGFAPSMRGGQAKNFGKDATIEFMTKNNLDLIVRGHEVFPHGFHEFFDGRIMSLFSCRNYGGPIAGKALYITDDGERELTPL